MIEDSDHEFRADFAQCSDIGAAAVHVAKLELMPQLPQFLKVWLILAYYSG